MTLRHRPVRQEVSSSRLIRPSADAGSTSRPDRRPRERAEAGANRPRKQCPDGKKAPSAQNVEWPTLATLTGCYAAWGLGVFGLSLISLPLAVLAVAFSVALHASLQHEIIHGHPFRNKLVNTALVFPNLGLFIPYLRFRDTHLAHHLNADLTDPYDDPESNYLDPAVWNRLSPWVRAALEFNNTLIGRVLIGTLVAQTVFILSDIRAARAGQRDVVRGWLWHIPAVALVLGVVGLSALPLWAYLLAAYAGLSIIKIRTFLEHQAHARVAARTVIIEDRGLLSFLFLNNNLHVVHHAHPHVAWYRLPALYTRQAARFQAQNGGYVYRSYAEIIRRYLFRRKDPVPHPFWR